MAGEFLVMAATLVHIKSRELLPVDQQAPVEDEEEGDDPRWNSSGSSWNTRSSRTQPRNCRLEEQQENVFPRRPGRLELEAETPPPRPEVSLFDLVNAVSAVLHRLGGREDTREIFEDSWTVSAKIEHLMRLVAGRATLKFSELFEGASTRSEVVCTFLALLELIRMKQLVCSQSEAFGEIEVGRPPAAPLPAAEPASAATVPQPAMENPQPL